MDAFANAEVKWNSSLLTQTTGRGVFHVLVAVVARVVAAGVVWPEDPPQNRWGALPTTALGGAEC